MIAARPYSDPFELLLELVERGQVPATEVAVARITGRYLARVDALRGLGPDELAGFVALGSRLVYIKSLALLPGTAPAEREVQVAQLNAELAEYRRYQAAARELAQRLTAPSFHRPVTERLTAHDLPAPTLDLAALAEAFNRAVRRAQPPRPVGRLRPLPTQDQVLGKLRGRLATGAFNLQDALDVARDRLELIMLFMGILELHKRGELSVRQTGAFHPILVEPSGA